MELEAVIDTSPVGIAVFDAMTGHPITINRESRRIAKVITDAGEPPEALVNVLTAVFPMAASSCSRNSRWPTI